MKLGDYLKDKNITQREFAELSRDLFTVYALAKWCQGQRIPRKDEMKIIFSMTEGLVTPNDFYDIY